MKYSYIFYLLLFCTGIIAMVTGGPGCANIIPPGGGPVDSLPPVLLRAEPPDSSLQFKEKTITFTFDEYIELQNVQQNLLISPTPEINPAVESRLKTVIVKLKDTLDANTTYFIDFGNAIQDINERNVLKNFRYVFSTGNAFDSLEFTGRVVLAETGNIDTTLIVMLHKTGEDSAVINKKPRYVTKLDNKGNFHFRFLPPETYYVYALKDDNGTRKYFSGEQLFAFAPQPVQISDTTPPLTLYAFAGKKKDPPTAPGQRTTQENRLIYTTSLSSGIQDLLKDFTFTFSIPLRSFDSSKIRLSTDSTFTPVQNYTWQKDTAYQTLSLKVAWKENTAYNLIMEKDFAEDTLGKKLLKTDTISFRTRRLTDYGSLRIRFQNLDLTLNPVLQFVQNNQLVGSFVLSSAEFYQPLFLPGSYDLQILYDDNKNGRWDPGSFFGSRKQPEIVKRVSKPLSVKADWDNEADIITPSRNE